MLLKPIQYTAYHGAGHAVLAHFLGVKFRRVSITDEDCSGHILDGGEYSEETEHMRIFAEESFWLRMTTPQGRGIRPLLGDVYGLPVQRSERVQLMPTELHVEVRGDVVIMVRKGAPLFDDTQDGMAAAVAAARDVGTTKILFDVRLADLTNLYSYIVRAVNLDPLREQATSFRICLVGLREQADVMSFIVRVREMHGWKFQWFLDMGEALKWLASSEATPLMDSLREAR